MIRFELVAASLMSSIVLRASLCVAADRAGDRRRAGAAAPASTTSSAEQQVADRREPLQADRRRSSSSSGDTKLYADEVEIFTDRGSRRRDRQRGHDAGQQPDRRRPRRVQHQDQARHVLQRRRHRQHQPPRQSPRPGAIALPHGATRKPTSISSGETIEKIGPKKYKITNGGFTTCVQPTPRWELSADTIDPEHRSLHAAEERDLQRQGRADAVHADPVLPDQGGDRATGF